MAICRFCGLEMSTADSCTVEKYDFEDGTQTRIRFGDERPRWRGRRCHDCGVVRGGLHHPGCDVERCPRCQEQAIMCDCADPSERNDDEASGGPPWVDIATVVEVDTDLLLQEVRDDGVRDQVFIEPIAKCGHVGICHVRQMERGPEPPLGEWFSLGRHMGPDTAAILFICRTKDAIKVSEIDLDVARRMSEYSERHEVLPWDLVYVTRTGNHDASELLQVPGLPMFEKCTYQRSIER